MKLSHALPDFFDGVWHLAVLVDFTKSDIERTTGASVDVVLV